MKTQPTPPPDLRASRWPYLLSFVGLLLRSGNANAAASSMTASKPDALVLPAWSLGGLLDSVASFLSGDRLIQVGIIGMCLALFFITRGKWR